LAASLLYAQQPALNSNPPAKDLGPSSAAPQEVVPDRAPPPTELRLVDNFDRNGDHRLDAAERASARAFLAQHPEPVPTLPSGRPAPAPVQSVPLEPAKPGERVSPAAGAASTGWSLFDQKTLRTVFLDFDDSDWEQELTDFARTDVLVPARLTVDGRTLSGVGVRFHQRAATPATAKGYKRSLDLALDYPSAGPELDGQRRLELRDAGADPTYLRTLLYYRVAREYIPTPRANFVRVAINGENWGAYVNTQPLDENFLRENFQTTEGARWIVQGSGTLAYLGDDPAAYRSTYRLLSAEDPAAWSALVRLCRVLSQTPTDGLEAALAPLLDLDSTLRFLALENALINQSGYGSLRGAYGLYLAPNGRFHLVPQDADASFRLIETTEYGERPREPRSGRADQTASAGKPGDQADAKGKEPLDPALQAYNPKNFPHQTGTNLAMLLSYSFIAKADTNLDEKVTREEWLTFARTWFLVMDEDQAGFLTRDQFIAKVRQLITPASIVDGRTKQTFGHDDAAALIARDFYAAMDEGHDDRLTSEELSAAFDRWFASWREPKTGVLTQAALQQGFTALFSQSVFQADQTFIAKHDPVSLADAERGGRGGGRGKRSGSGINFGPMHLGGSGRTSRADSRGLITFSEELDPLAALDETNKPLLTKLLLVPGLRHHYLEYLREITENWLTWSKLGPIAKEYHELIAAEVAKDTHKPASYAHFVQELDQDTNPGARDGDEAPSLKNFITERHTYLLKDETLMGGTGGW
jgi:hypothetical protein